MTKVCLKCGERVEWDKKTHQVECPKCGFIGRKWADTKPIDRRAKFAPSK